MEGLVVQDPLRSLAVFAQDGHGLNGVATRRRIARESITQSVPSSTAFATSPASARVGSGALLTGTRNCVAVIWVAVITGFPRKLRRAAHGQQRLGGGDLGAVITGSSGWR